MNQQNFRDYFEDKFQLDLAAFISAMPASQRRHFNRSPFSYSISMNYLVDPKPALQVIPLECRPYFATSLYFTSLLDQSMYTYCRLYYERFRRLTNYPKVTGACPGACQNLASPSIALERTNLSNDDPLDYIQGKATFGNLVTLIPVVSDAEAYFMEQFPLFLQKHFSDLAEHEALCRRIFDRKYRNI